MFKVGDKIVCLDNSDNTNWLDSHNPYTKNPLELYQIYTIKKIIYGEKEQNHQVVIELNNVVLMSFTIKRFISLSEYRKMKINKIKKGLI